MFPFRTTTAAEIIESLRLVHRAAAAASSANEIPNTGSLPLISMRRSAGAVFAADGRSREFAWAAMVSVHQLFGKCLRIAGELERFKRQHR